MGTSRTDRRYARTDIRVVIDGLYPIRPGWGNYFRTGNTTVKFQQIDREVVVVQLYRLMRLKRARNRRPMRWTQWTEDLLNGHGRYR